VVLLAPNIMNHLVISSKHDLNQKSHISGHLLRWPPLELSKTYLNMESSPHTAPFRSWGHRWKARNFSFLNLCSNFEISRIELCSRTGAAGFPGPNRASVGQKMARPSHACCRTSKVTEVMYMIRKAYSPEVGRPRSLMSAGFLQKLPPRGEIWAQISPQSNAQIPGKSTCLGSWSHKLCIHFLAGWSNSPLKKNEGADL